MAFFLIGLVGALIGGWILIELLKLVFAILGEILEWIFERN